MCTITVIVPVFHDAGALARLLDRGGFGEAELVVASTPEDGGSLAALRAAHPSVRWIESSPGRARQMNAGAAAATGEWLLFLHADTRLPPSWAEAIAAAASDRRVVGGCFRFALDSRAPAARLLEWGVRLRVAWLGLPYGDQALFVRRDVFDVIGGYAVLPIMEDVDLVRRLRRRGRLCRSVLPAVTSARRWEREGWIRRTALNVLLIGLYLAGVPPDRLICLDRARRRPLPGATRIYL